MGLKLFFGDLHNHNGVTYGKGSLGRSIEVAREHLDFFAMTVHGVWHDIPPMPGGRDRIWNEGARKLAQRWPDVVREVSAANEPGRFVSIIGYEWHSSRFGDYCLLYPGDGGELYFPDNLADLQAHARRHNALLIPHHIAYARGWRGGNFDSFDPNVTPAIEIYSEHGLSERDRGPYDYLRHSLGGRSTANTVQALLARGMRFGFVAATDTHWGFPGAYGEGLAGIWAEELSRESLFDALRARRTTALTGDRIELWFEVDGQPMGSELPARRQRRMHVRVHGADEIDRVEVIRNGRVIHRHFPLDAVPNTTGAFRCLVRVEYGWGAWAALELDRTCDWELSFSVNGGQILSATPCFVTAPFDEDRRDRITERSPARWSWRSFTSRRQAFLDMATKAMVFELEASFDSTVRLEIAKPAERVIERPLAELAEANAVEFTGPFPSESLIVHRPVFAEHCQSEFDLVERIDDPGPDYYYVRVTQSNGQMAWSSPVWVG